MKFLHCSSKAHITDTSSLILFMWLWLNFLSVMYKAGELHEKCIMYPKVIFFHNSTLILG